MFKRWNILFILLSLTLVVPSMAQESRTVWNSSTGSTVQVFQAPGRGVTRVRLEQPGKKALEYQVSKATAQGFEYMAGKSKITATFTGRDEITLRNPNSVNVFRWTKRGGSAQFPIPKGESCERTYWRNEDRSRIFMLLSTPEEASLMLSFRSGKTNYILSYAARWLDYPRTIQYKKNGSQAVTIKFFNPMVFKSGGVFYFQSHPDFEAKKPK